MGKWNCLIIILYTQCFRKRLGIKYVMCLSYVWSKEETVSSSVSNNGITPNGNSINELHYDYNDWVCNFLSLLQKNRNACAVRYLWKHSGERNNLLSNNMRHQLVKSYKPTSEKEKLVHLSKFHFFFTMFWIVLFSRDIETCVASGRGL